MKTRTILLMALLGSLQSGFARAQFISSPCTLVVNPQPGNWCVDSDKLVPQVYNGTSWQPWVRSLNRRGVWRSTATYSVMDVVTSYGSTYVSLTSGNIDHMPGSNPSHWSRLGPVRASGPTRSTGVSGEVGPTVLSATLVRKVTSPIGTTSRLIDVKENSSADGVYNVKAFGAEGDCSKDDAPAIQSAVNAALSHGCAPVYFPPTAPRACYHTAEPIIEQLALGDNCGGRDFWRQSKLYSSSQTPAAISPAANVPGIVVLLGGYGTQTSGWITWLGSSLATGHGYSYSTGGAAAQQNAGLNLNDVLGPQNVSDTYQGPLQGLSAFDVRFFFSVSANATDADHHSFTASYGTTSFCVQCEIGNTTPAGDLAYQAYEAGTDDQGQLGFRLNVGGTVYNITSGSTTYPRDGSVHEYEGSYDGTTIRLFLDGTIVGSTTASGTISQSAHEDMMIGIAPAVWPDQNYADPVNAAHIDSVELSKVARHTSGYRKDTAKYPGDSNTIALVNFDRFYGRGGFSSMVAPLVMPDNLNGRANPNAYLIMRDHADAAVGPSADIEELSINSGSIGIFEADGIAPYVHKFDLENQTSWGLEEFYNAFEGVYDEGFIQSAYGMNLGAGGAVSNLRVTGSLYGLVNPSVANFYTFTPSKFSFAGAYLVSFGAPVTFEYYEADTENGGATTDIITNGQINLSLFGGILETPGRAYPPILVYGDSQQITNITLDAVQLNLSGGLVKVVADNGMTTVNVFNENSSNSNKIPLVGLSDTTAQVVNFGGIGAAATFSTLGTPENGSYEYCSNCKIANPCAGSGTGAFAKRLNGVWVCN
jgi:hypothetical protein